MRRSVIIIMALFLMVPATAIGQAGVSGAPGASGVTFFASQAQAEAAIKASPVWPGISLSFGYSTPDGSIIMVTEETRNATSAGIVPGGLAFSPSTLSIASSGCWIGTFTIRASSLYVLQYKWQHYVYWCGNGSADTNYITNAGYNLATGSFWNYKGYGSYLINDRGYVWYAARQGHYQLCYTAICPQNAYPRHYGVYRGNGTWSTISYSVYG